MLSIFVQRGTMLERVQVGPGDEMTEPPVRIDLVNPTVQEDKQVEHILGIAVPTREEMQEIEVSSRLYLENGARYMTATLMCGPDGSNPRPAPVSYILTAHRLVTVRYDEPKPFLLVAAKIGRSCPSGITGDTIQLDLLAAIIDRSADILERDGSDVDTGSNEIFEPAADRGHSRK